MTQLCINCNAPRVRRSGDTFTCATCGYTWDVAHEQANAAYLASQGRRPAAPTVPPAKEPPPADARLVAALEQHTVPDLDLLAASAGVDFGDARLKDEKIAALARAGIFTLDDAGAVVIAAGEDG